MNAFLVKQLPFLNKVIQILFNLYPIKVGYFKSLVYRKINFFLYPSFIELK
jgi:hypothetical protein